VVQMDAADRGGKRHSAGNGTGYVAHYKRCGAAHYERRGGCSAGVRE